MTYTLIRSDRKTLAIQITDTGEVVVRAPRRMAEKDIRRIVAEREDWINRHLAARKEKIDETNAVARLTYEEVQALAEKAVKEIPPRVAFWAKQMGVTYGRITIRNQKTRWGSCSAQGNLNFNCALMLAPPEVTDSVIVHELAHRKEMNHSPAFYKAVYDAFPEYDKWNRWLKENGAGLMKKIGW